MAAGLALCGFDRVHSAKARARAGGGATSV